MDLNVRAYRVELLSPCPAGPGAAGGFEGDGVADEPVVTAGEVLETVVSSASIILQKISPMPSASAIAAMMLHLLCRLASVIESLRSLASEFLPLSGSDSVAIAVLVVGPGNQRLPAGERSKNNSLRFAGAFELERQRHFTCCPATRELPRHPPCDASQMMNWGAARQLRELKTATARQMYCESDNDPQGKNSERPIADLPGARRTASTHSRST